MAATYRDTSRLLLVMWPWILSAFTTPRSMVESRRTVPLAGDTRGNPEKALRRLRFISAVSVSATTVVGGLLAGTAPISTMWGGSDKNAPLRLQSTISTDIASSLGENNQPWLPRLHERTGMPMGLGRDDAPKENETQVSDGAFLATIRSGSEFKLICRTNHWRKHQSQENFSFRDELACRCVTGRLCRRPCRGDRWRARGHVRRHSHGCG